MSAFPRPLPSALERAKALPRRMPSETLRGGGVPATMRVRSPIRAEARARGAAALAKAMAETQTSNLALARAFGLKSERDGAEIVTQRKPVTFGEFLDRMPVPVLLRVLRDGLARRVDAEQLLLFRTEDLRVVAALVDQLLSLSK